MPRVLYDTVRVVEVVEGVPILERVGVTVRGRSIRTSENPTSRQLGE